MSKNKAISWFSALPLHKFHADLAFYNKQTILVLVDVYNGYTKYFLLEDLEKNKNKSNRVVYKKLHEYFSKYNLHNSIGIVQYTDHGKEFSKKNLPDTYDYIQHQTSAPYQSHVINWVRGEIEKRGADGKRYDVYNKNADYETKINLHRSSKASLAESKIRSLKVRLRKIIIDSAIEGVKPVGISGKKQNPHKALISQEQLDVIEDDVNKNRKYQEKIPEKEGLYVDDKWVKYKEKLDEREEVEYRFDIADLVYVKTQNLDIFDKKSLRHEYTPFHLIIIERRKFQKIPQYKVSTIAGDVVNRWFYEHELKK